MNRSGVRNQRCRCGERTAAEEGWLPGPPAPQDGLPLSPLLPPGVEVPSLPSTARVPGLEVDQPSQVGLMVSLWPFPFLSQPVRSPAPSAYAQSHF